MEEGTEGEKLIKEYFESEDIKYEFQKKLPNLKEDIKLFRVSDFYLPQYKVYVEFFGKWNVSEKYKEAYRRKKDIYKENNVPCVYLYPDNLGILNFIFKRRLKKVLREYKKLKWQLLKLNWNLFVEHLGVSPIIIGVLIYYLSNLIMRIFLILLLIGVVYSGLNKSFFKKIEK